MRLTPNPTPTISGPRNGGGISFAPVLARGPQGLPGPGSAAWVAGEAVTTGAVRQAPDGSYIKSTASRTTRSSFDATEQGFWTSVGSDPTTFDGIKLAASFAGKPTVGSQAAAGSHFRVQAAGGVVTPGLNTIAGYTGNAIASDIGTASVLGGGTVGRENIVGATNFTTVGTSTPNVTATGSGADYSVITGGYDNIAGGLMSVISGGHNYTKTTTTHGTIGGGSFHHIDNGDYHVIAGGTGNSINTSGGSRCTIGGGDNHSITGTISGATIAGGRSNTASASQASIGGGLSNNASGDRSTIAGGNSNAASGQYASVGGGSGNTASGARATVAGGSGNTASAQGATVSGGETSTASGIDSTVGGGTLNTAGGQNATVAGGKSNQANTSNSSVGGGYTNVVSSSTYGTISGGYTNSVTGQYGYVGGGDHNTASGVNATVAGGSNNTASGNYSIAQGLRAKATRYGQKAHAAGYFAAIGDAQTSTLVARRVTTNGTATELRIDGGSTQLVLDDDTTWAFRIQVVARNTATDGESAAYFVTGAIRRGAGVGTTTLIGTPTVTAYEDAAIAAAWDFAVTADATNGALSMKGTGEAAKNIQWVARIDLTETTG